MSIVRAVLFDLDGVLVDVSGSYRRAIEETVEHFTGARPSPGAVQELKDGGGFNDDWRLTAVLVARTGANVTFGDIVREFNRRYRGENWNGLIAVEPPLLTTGLLDDLKSCFGCLGLVTGRPREEAEFTLSRFGWTDRFDAFVTMEDVEGRGKPDPLPLQLALTRLEVAPREAVYVGDSVDDMTAARAAGCLAVGFVPPYLDAVRHADLLRDCGAHVVIVDHEALADAVYASGN
jgi:HAD superfamily phosphatase